eukprot:2423513-Rhodomonas_salina.2
MSAQPGDSFSSVQSQAQQIDSDNTSWYLALSLPAWTICLVVFVVAMKFDTGRCGGLQWQFLQRTFVCPSHQKQHCFVGALSFTWR